MKTLAERIWEDHCIEDPSEENFCPFADYKADGGEKRCHFSGPADVCKLCLLGELVNIGSTLITLLEEKK